MYLGRPVIHHSGLWVVINEAVPDACQFHASSSATQVCHQRKVPFSLRATTPFGTRTTLRHQPEWSARLRSPLGCKTPSFDVLAYHIPQTNFWGPAGLLSVQWEPNRKQFPPSATPRFSAPKSSKKPVN